MSKLLDLMQRISEGSAAPLGFGLPRSGSLPGLALIGGVNGPSPQAAGLAAEVGLDALMVYGAAGEDGGKQLNEVLGAIPWGPYFPELSEEAAQACREQGADFMAFALEGTAVAAIAGQEESARILAVDTDLNDRELRALASLPVDAFLLDFTSLSQAWTLSDLAKVGSISRRVELYILLQVSRAPAPKELEALRDMGVNGLVATLASVSKDDLIGLKSALAAMPRPRSRRRERLRATVPGAGFAPAQAPSREDDDDEEYDC